MGKPVLAFPEPGNFEQQINAQLINDSGGGMAAPHRLIDDALLRSFLDKVDDYRSLLATHDGSGNQEAVRLVDALIRDSSFRAGSRVRATTSSPRVLTSAG